MVVRSGFRLDEVNVRRRRVFGKNREFFWKKVAGARFDPNTALSGRICVIFMDSNSGTRQRRSRFKFGDGARFFLPFTYYLLWAGLMEK